MALLSLCLCQGYQAVVCHVNYRKRPSAENDEQLLRQYCQENKVRLYVDYPEKKEKGNFQKWAREARYDFFRQVYQKEKCTALLLGHQKDDHVETFLMSQQRGSKCWYYGIARETTHHGMRIIRPLLELRKRETREYCLTNGIPFGEDESNFTDQYSRNRIRHELVETADDEQMKKWCRQIAALNEENVERIAYLSEKYPEEDIELENYRNEEREMRHLILRRLFSRYLPDNPAEAFISEIDRQLLNAKKNLHIRLSERYRMFLDYGYFYVADLQEQYCYQLERGQWLETPYFRICSSGELIEQIGVNEDEWPLTIRPARPGDAIELRYGEKKLNRFFIDRKIPQRLRRLWPVVENCRGEIIFVAGIGCQKHHFCTNEQVFMIKC